MRTNKEYTINTTSGSMKIIERATGREIAEYHLTAGQERNEIARMRRTIDKHLQSGGTLGNYQW
jgi:hypothetical protein